MRVKISEKRLLIGVVLLLIGIAIFFNTTIARWPVRVSERLILFNLLAVVSLVMGVVFLSRSFYRQAS